MVSTPHWLGMNAIKSLLAEAFPIIEKFAPTLGIALGGAPGFAAGYILPLLANAFGSSPKDIGSIAKNILSNNNTPNILKDLESSHGDWLSTLATDIPQMTSGEISINLKWDNSKISD